MCASLNINGQGWAKIDRSGWFRLVRQGIVTYLAGGCECACKSRVGCAWVWVSLDRYGQGWAGLDRSD